MTASRKGASNIKSGATNKKKKRQGDKEKVTRSNVRVYNH